MFYNYGPGGMGATGTTGRLLRSSNDAQREQGENIAFEYQKAHERDQHERSLQGQEQQRRAYESETARMGQEQKYNVLGNLLGAPRRIV